MRVIIIHGVSEAYNFETPRGRMQAVERATRNLSEPTLADYLELVPYSDWHLKLAVAELEHRRIVKVVDVLG